jgi:solute carrier family 25 carnitine/acylcarnitine transporter 20/29
MQTDAIAPAQRQFKSTLHCAQQIFKTAGISGFLRGLSPTLVRVRIDILAVFLIETHTLSFLVLRLLLQMQLPL